MPSADRYNPFILPIRTNRVNPPTLELSKLKEKLTKLNGLADEILAYNTTQAAQPAFYTLVQNFENEVSLLEPHIISHFSPPADTGQAESSLFQTLESEAKLAEKEDVSTYLDEYQNDFSQLIVKAQKVSTFALKMKENTLPTKQPLYVMTKSPTGARSNSPVGVDSLKLSPLAPPSSKKSKIQTKLGDPFEGFEGFYTYLMGHASFEKEKKLEFIHKPELLTTYMTKKRPIATAHLIKNRLEALKNKLNTWQDLTSYFTGKYGYLEQIKKLQDALKNALEKAESSSSKVIGGTPLVQPLGEIFSNLKILEEKLGYLHFEDLLLIEFLKNQENPETKKAASSLSSFEVNTVIDDHESKEAYKESIQRAIACEIKAELAKFKDCGVDTLGTMLARTSPNTLKAILVKRIDALNYYLTDTPSPEGAFNDILDSDLNQLKEDVENIKNVSDFSQEGSLDGLLKLLQDLEKKENSCSLITTTQTLFSLIENPESKPEDYLHKLTNVEKGTSWIVKTVYNLGTSTVNAFSNAISYVTSGEAYNHLCIAGNTLVERLDFAQKTLKQTGYKWLNHQVKTKLQQAEEGLKTALSKPLNTQIEEVIDDLSDFRKMRRSWDKKAFDRLFKVIRRVLDESSTNQDTRNERNLLSQATLHQLKAFTETMENEMQRFPHPYDTEISFRRHAKTLFEAMYNSCIDELGPLLKEEMEKVHNNVYGESPKGSWSIKSWLNRHNNFLWKAIHTKVIPAFKKPLMVGINQFLSSSAIENALSIENATHILEKSDDWAEKMKQIGICARDNPDSRPSVSDLKQEYAQKEEALLERIDKVIFPSSVKGSILDAIREKLTGQSSSDSDKRSIWYAIKEKLLSKTIKSQIKANVLKVFLKRFFGDEDNSEIFRLHNLAEQLKLAFPTLEIDIYSKDPKTILQYKIACIELLEELVKTVDPEEQSINSINVCEDLNKENTTRFLTAAAKFSDRYDCSAKTEDITFKAMQSFAINALKTPSILLSSDAYNNHYDNVVKDKAEKNMTIKSIVKDLSSNDTRKDIKKFIARMKNESDFHDKLRKFTADKMQKLQEKIDKIDSEIVKLQNDPDQSKEGLKLLEESLTDALKRQESLKNELKELNQLLNAIQARIDAKDNIIDSINSFYHSSRLQLKGYLKSKAHS